MGLNNPGMIAKIFLTLRARSDAKKSRFEDTYFSNRPSHKPNVGEIRVQVPAQTQNPSVTEAIPISPFMRLEISQFAPVRDAWFGRKLMLTRHYDRNKKRRIFCRTFNKTVYGIDGIIGTYTTRLEFVFKKYGNQLAEYLRRQNEHEARREAHLVQMCINQAANTREEFYHAAKDYYDIIIALLSKNVELIHGMVAKLKSLRSYRYARVRYYYQKAAYYTNLPSTALDDELLACLGDTAIIDEYEEILRRSEETLERLKGELATLKDQSP